MTALQLRKKMLLMESELNRLALHAECRRLGEAINWPGRLREAQAQVAPWTLLLAPLVGLALALGLRRSSSGTGFWAGALQIAPALVQLARIFLPPSNDSK